MWRERERERERETERERERCRTGLKFSTLSLLKDFAADTTACEAINLLQPRLRDQFGSQHYVIINLLTT